MGVVGVVPCVGESTAMGVVEVVPCVGESTAMGVVDVVNRILHKTVYTKGCIWFKLTDLV